MCALIATAILCDIVDSRYLRASVYCLIAGCFSFFGLMHGANYIYPDGRVISAIGTSDADFYTTDLGEFTFSWPVKATHLSFQVADGKLVDPGFVASYEWTYAIEDGG